MEIHALVGNSRVVSCDFILALVIKDLHLTMSSSRVSTRLTGVSTVFWLTVSIMLSSRAFTKLAELCTVQCVYQSTSYSD